MNCDSCSTDNCGISPLADLRRGSLIALGQNATLPLAKLMRGPALVLNALEP
jgi:hypothetical protein